MKDNDRRNIKDFYDHRAYVLKRIQEALLKEKQSKQPRK